MKIEGLKLVKTYTYEIGYEIDQLKVMNYSISKQFPAILNYVHDIKIKVQSLLPIQFK
jgi:hypothetical protein